MASNYNEISEENERRYGTDIGRIGPMLLADRYDDRTHFIFELLQNAEDALKRRAGWTGSRTVEFRLTAASLTVAHFGKLFDERDVRGICGIAESTKDENSIGRFGIGFKSVYTFTDTPEIHSGDEDFVVESYVRPRAIGRLDRDSQATVIVLPLKPDDDSAGRELAAGFQGISSDALLFLRHIDAIDWSIEGGTSGVYLRSAAEILSPGVRRIKLVGQQSGQAEVDQSWLVFDRDVRSAEGRTVGAVEIAFALSATEGEADEHHIEPVALSPLVVYFPTVVSTNLGALAQGPYRTTPSRDNVPKNDPWNAFLVQETASLFRDALRWMRDQGSLDVSALRCLPLDPGKFRSDTMFAPLFATVRQALLDEPLLPGLEGAYISARQAKLARTQDLRELFDAQQLSTLFDEPAAWLTGDITQDKAPEVRKYLLDELEVAEVTPAGLVSRLTQAFLEAQSDEWISRLYGFLSGQPAILSRAESVPLIRLTNGQHVPAKHNGRPNAFLPSDFETGFPTVRRAVCETSESRAFLRAAGVVEPDPVDDVIRNVLPSYAPGQTSFDEHAYASDLARILRAFATDSAAHKFRLVQELRTTAFLRVIDPGTETRSFAKPAQAYIATERLRLLFAGVAGVRLVDDSLQCLRGEDTRELLEACGAVRYLRPQTNPDAYKDIDRAELRKRSGHELTSGINDRLEDWVLEGVDSLCELIPTLAPEDRALRSRLLWESLGDLEERRGRAIFQGHYRWTHYGSYEATFPSTFIQTLNEKEWVAQSDGKLTVPGLVRFDTLGWRPNPFLASLLEFKPAAVDELARETGIEPEALDLLRKLGITSLAELTSRLMLDETAATEQRPSAVEEPFSPATDDPYAAAADLYGEMPTIAPGTRDPEGGNSLARSQTGARTASTSHNRDYGGSPKGDDHGSTISERGQPNPARASNSGASRPFISYVAADPHDSEVDPDGLAHAERMKIEELAIDHVIRMEPGLARTSQGNPGFDLYQPGASGEPIRWVEIKAMTGSLLDRPVGLSSTQFEFAQSKGNAFWLYVVENVGSELGPTILRIQNPVGLTRTFTFDRGWRQFGVGAES